MSIRTTALALAMLAGLCQPVDVSAAQAVVSAAQADEQLYVATPGVLEFTGQMIVRPRQDLYAVTNPRPDASPERSWVPVAGQKAAAVESADPARARIIDQVIEHFGEVDEYIVQVPAGHTENTYAQVLMATGDYEYVTPNWLCYTTETVPNDPNFGDSWQHINVESARAWDIFTGNSSTIIAIADTGADLNHPDLAPRWVSGFNSQQNLAQVNGGNVEDDHGHGTFVAGCAAATGNNGTQVVGMGWNFSVMPIRVTPPGAGGSSSSADLDQAARWAADNGATVVNTSFSGVDGANVQTTGAYCKARGTLSFRSAGNDNRNLSGFDHADVVVVGASTQSDTKASFSAFGLGVDLTGPGVGVRSTTNGGGQGTSSGTSFSSPIAAGIGAMIAASNPTLDIDDVEQILFDTCDDIGVPGEDNTFGHGRVNLFQAMLAAANPIDITFTPLAGIPDELVPATATIFDVMIEIENDTMIGTPRLVYQENGGSMTPVVMTDQGGDVWRATLPAFDCGGDPNFFLLVDLTTLGAVNFPSTGAFEAVVGTVDITFTDTSEVDTGWVVSGITAGTAGGWARGLPQGFGRGDPSVDAADAGQQAWLTGIVSGVDNTDVDNGTTTITSESFEAGAGSTISYSYWLNDVTNGALQGGDALTIEVSSNDGASYSTARTYTTAFGSWRADELVEGTDFAASSAVRLRVSASDLGTQNVVEAGIDNIAVTSVICTNPGSCPGDIADDFGTLGADGMVGFGDFLALLGLVGPCPGMTPGCSGDIADDFGTLGADGIVSFGDFLALLGLVGPCP